MNDFNSEQEQNGEAAWSRAFRTLAGAAIIAVVVIVFVIIRFG